MKEIHEEVFNFLMVYHNREPENFFFITRKINRYNKLDEGYWFLGNDDYLAVSFWTGNDKLTRTPRIFFKIKANGESSIEFRNKDVFNHTDFFHPDLIKAIGASKTVNGYSKKSQEKSYIMSLFLFLCEEKSIIDEFINTKEFKDFSVSEWASPIEFIKPEIFRQQIEIINNYRDKPKKEYYEKDTLRGFVITNFGPIQKINLEIPLQSKWIFLTGENGSGKTSILKAIATGLCQNNDLEERIAHKKNYGNFTIDILLNSEYNNVIKTTTESNENYKDKNILVDGFAAYGPVRLFSEGSIDLKIVRNEEKIHKKLTYGLFNPIGILQDLSGDSALNSKPKYHELIEDSLIGNLELILPNIASVDKNEKGELVFYEYYEDEDIINNELIFEQLPSGTRNFAALILDLLIRLQNQQPGIEDIADYVGVVLIDEIDIHLHPKLQIELVKQLSATFPKIQFIVSTHSPVTLLGAPEHSVFLKVKKTKYSGTVIERLTKLEKEIKYLTPNTILTSDIFDFDFLEEFTDQEFEKAYLEDNYEDIEKNKEIQKRLEGIDKSIFPEDLFNDQN